MEQLQPDPLVDMADEDLEDLRDDLTLVADRQNSNSSKIVNCL
jgi:hypothetical protein